MSTELPLHDFANRFDALLAHQGPPALFTVDADGELRLSPDRTRDTLEHVGDDPMPMRWCHLLVRDQATGWVQYILATSPDIIPHIGGCEVREVASQQEAQRQLDALGPLPLAPTPWHTPDA